MPLLSGPVLGWAIRHFGSLLMATLLGSSLYGIRKSGKQAKEKLDWMKAFGKRQMDVAATMQSRKSQAAQTALAKAERKERMASEATRKKRATDVAQAMSLQLFSNLMQGALGLGGRAPVEGAAPASRPPAGLGPGPPTGIAALTPDMGRPTDPFAALMSDTESEMVQLLGAREGVA